MTVFGIELTLRKNRIQAMPQLRGDAFFTLKHVSPGRSVRVKDFAAELSKGRREQLLAYGLNPGRRVLVRQRTPVCVVQVDHLELALEVDLAAQVLVED